MEPETKLTPAQEEQKKLLGSELGDQLAQQQKEEEDAKKKKADEEAAALAAKNKNKKIVLKNTLGEAVDPKDYFFSTTGKDAAPIYFHEVCGFAVEREDMLTIFNKVFKPRDGILFYKTQDKEVYIIIVPIKHSSIVGAEHNSVDGEFQKHAISFVSEGSVNLDMLRTKLLKVSSTIKIAE